MMKGGNQMGNGLFMNTKQTRQTRQHTTSAGAYGTLAVLRLCFGSTYMWKYQTRTLFTSF
jgi:hypothetical protein